MNQNKRKFFKLFGVGAAGITLGSIAKPKQLIDKITKQDNIENNTSKIEVKIHPQSVKRTNKG